MSGDHNMNQKPVAWFHEEKYKTHFTTDPSEDMIGKYWQPLYTTPPAAQRQPQYNKTEMNCFVQNLYDQKMREGKHGHYETMFHVVHRAIKAAHGIGENK